MREIKFRAWDKKNKRMQDLDIDSIDKYELIIWKDGWTIEFDNNEDDKVYEGSEKYELMQSTGLKDKNGVEIYEGDILNFNGKIGTVYWDEARVAFKTTLTKKTRDYWNTWLDMIKVIGNIYENKELLNVE